MLRVGDPAPDFALPDEDGDPVRLKTLLAAGRVLLVFFPGVVSPASERHLGAIRDRHAELGAAGIEVLAVSPDDHDTHRQFRDRLDLPLLDQLQATTVTEDGAWIYPEAPGGRNAALVGSEGEITGADASLKAYVIPTNEELLIARDTFRVVADLPRKW